MREVQIFDTLLELAKKRTDDPLRASAIECVGTLVVNSGKIIINIIITEKTILNIFSDKTFKIGINMKKLIESGLCDELCLNLGKTMPSYIEASVLTFLRHVFQNAQSNQSLLLDMNGMSKLATMIDSKTTNENSKVKAISVISEGLKLHQTGI